MQNPIDSLIKECGGEEVICRAARQNGTPITYKAVRKWISSGVPSKRISMVAALSKRDANYIQKANETVNPDLKFNECLNTDAQSSSRAA